jgi:four helix bundle protein
MLHKDLDVYKLSLLVVKRTYELTASFPKSEIFGLVSQMRRAAISIPSNIAEGSARRSKNELAQFLYVALGSISELETQIEISQMLNFITETETKQLIKDIIRVRQMLINLIKSVKTP